MAKDKGYVLDVGDVTGETLKIKLAPPRGFWKIDALNADFSEDAPLRTTVVAASRAQDQNGLDAAESLAENDNKFLVMPRKGDSTEVVFRQPPRPAGTERSFILKVTGYYDIHLAASGEPNLEMIRKIHSEPGFTLTFALQEYLKQREAQGVRTGKGNN